VLFRSPIARKGACARIRIVTVGRLVEKKGVEDAIRAVADLPLSYEFTVAGDGPLRPSLERIAAGLGVNVRFIGALRQDEVADLLASANIFLAPSVTASDGDVEGIPVSIMEAMASGLPVVSTRHAAIPELLTDGRSGLLAAEHDVPRLTRHLMTLAGNPELRVRMGAAGRKTMVREFDIAILNAQLERLYHQLLRPHGAPPGVLTPQGTV
jgi:colanic acid/amylovoran biosynthesis glycosyltransferase